MSNARKSLTSKFEKSEDYTLKNKKEEFLGRAILSLKNEKEVAWFLRDVLTPNEISEFSNRLSIAQMVYEGKSYAEIAKEMKTSTTTVSRVAYWLFSGCGGYNLVMKRLLKKR